MRLLPAALILLTSVPAVNAQSSFEVASIRPSIQVNGRYGNYRNSGGPGTKDPGRMILENFDIRSLILKAYDLPFYRFVGPESLFDVRFDITATIPAGATKEQFLAMQQNLLATRFGLQVHRENKEMPIYELIVVKGGSRIKEAVPREEAAFDPAWLNGTKKDGEGFPVPPPGVTMYVSTGDRATLQGAGETMEQLTSTLAGQLSAPVKDATGLTGKYDFTLRFIPGSLRPDQDPGLNLESALPQQLGLTLRKTRGQVDVLVVDHVEKTPVEN